MGLRSAAPVTEQLPSIDAIMENVNDSTQTESAKPAEGKQEVKEDGLDRIEREQKHRREQFKLQQRIKELEAKQGNPSDKASGIDLDSKNPFKDVAKAKNMSQDEIVRLALEAMDDELTPAEKKDEFKNLSPQEIADLVKKQLKEEQAKEAEENGKKSSEEKAISDFKANISKRALELEVDYPLVNSLGGSDSVYMMIEEQFLADSKEFGEEYAQENMMKPDDAIKKVNEVLAKSVKEALKSKNLKKFLLDAIKEEGNEAETQSEVDEQLNDRDVTLNNKDFRAGTEPAVKPKFNSSAEELDYLINKFI
jgi:hypothetical protein